MTNSNYTQGGDARAISRIANEHYGSSRNMFDAHGWDVPGDKMMTSAPVLIVKEYGSIRRFEAVHEEAGPQRINEIWTEETSVFFTSFWGWTPETWGTVGFSKERGKNPPGQFTQATDRPVHLA